jgi:glyoxylase-like metal-dependent hydrolase (beta-lactamase superfamily II)
VSSLRVLSVLVALVGLPVHGRAETYPPLSHPLAIERVPGKDVFYSIGNPEIPSKGNEGNTSNAGYVMTSDGVVVFDALGTPSLAWALLNDIRSRTDKAVRYVVVSHYHADHIYGLQVFKDHTEAHIIAQERAADYTENSETSEERAGIRLDQRKSALSPWVNEKTRIVKPDRVFKDDLDISIGGKDFSLIYAGPAHSSSDIMMLVEPDGVLFAGDIVQSGRIPFMNADDVSTDRWLEALERVRKLDPKFIIPGHGRPSTAAQEAISFTKDYITYIRTAMKKAVDDWVDFDTAYQATDWSRYINLPAFASNNRGNAYRVYLELQSAQFAK